MRQLETYILRPSTSGQAIQHTILHGSKGGNDLLRAVAGTDREQVVKYGGYVMNRAWEKLKVNVDALMLPLPGSGVIEPVDPRQPPGVFWAAQTAALHELADNMEHLDNLEYAESSVRVLLHDERDQAPAQSPSTCLLASATTAVHAAVLHSRIKQECPPHVCITHDPEAWCYVKATLHIAFQASARCNCHNLQGNQDSG